MEENMIKDNKNYNEMVKPNTEFLNELKSKLPQFFINEKYDEEGNLISEGYFDIERFQESIRENNINEIKEGYQLSFIGKDYAKKQAGEKPTTVVVPDNEHNQEENNKNSKNLFFSGDNLEVLKHLQNNYRNSIDVIYIDPPYNTGSDGFVYPDNFEYSDEVLQDVFGLNENELNKLKSIQGKSTHSAWLTFMYPRLMLAKNLLKENGVIFVSIDDNEQSSLKLLLDESFGEINFLGQFIRKTSYGEKTAKPMINKHHEYCLLYSKDVQSIVDNNTIKGRLKTFEEYENPDNDPNGEWKKDSYLIKIDSGRVGHARYPITNPFLNLTHYPPVYYNESNRKQWHYIESTFNDFVKNGRVVFYKTLEEMGNSSYSFFIKKYKNEIANLHGNISTLEFDNNDFVNAKGTARMSDLFEDNAFLNSYPKPVNFIREIVQACTYDSRGKIIMDFFAGSSTTADAVMQLNAEDGGNRQFIMVQIDEPTYVETDRNTLIARKGSETAFNAGYMSIDEISRERIKRASQKIREQKGLTLPENFDGGFKHYRVVKPTQASINDLEAYDPNTGMFVDSKGMQMAFSESGFDDMIQPFSSEGLDVPGDATGVDTILTTWMIQDGYKLDNEVHQLEIDGYNVFYVEPTRVYLIGNNWNSNNTKILLNKIGNYDLNVQTVVIYGYSFGLESIRELELGLKQLPNKVNLVKRY